MSIYSPTRRNVLRGMVATGYALVVRRGIAAEAPAGTMEKSQVKYQSQPSGDQKCTGCMNFESESNACKVVAGDISPDGWCKTLWSAKQG